jgi:putative hydrolase of the HAD superfamily
MDARLPALLEELGLAALLDAIVLPSNCGLAKPDPRIFRHALARLGARAESALYVGDREVDCVAAARAAGLRAWRYDPRASAGTSEVLTDWAQLAERLQGFARASRSG